MILLDTSVLSELMKPLPNPDVVHWVDEQPVASLFICAVTRAEIELGIALLPGGKRKEAITSAAQDMFTEFDGRSLVFGDLAAAKYGQLMARQVQNGRSMTVEDGQIAAIALVHGLTLATRNTKDFDGIAGLDLVDPWD